LGALSSKALTATRVSKSGAKTTVKETGRRAGRQLRFRFLRAAPRLAALSTETPGLRHGVRTGMESSVIRLARTIEKS
jgi:hypothetical protein